MSYTFVFPFLLHFLTVYVNWGYDESLVVSL